MPVQITRHMATVKGERQVHYRRAGSGPPVLLLHQSPTSSREYLPLIQELADAGHTVFAPDTPGNGISDPLPVDTPEMADFADGVANLMDELGLKRAVVYGFHTGAVCTLELARRHPEKVALGVVNGYVQMPQEDVAEIFANYLPPFKPDWSGSHLTWAWARLREQYIFFPWYRKDVARRTNFDLPPPPQIHAAAMDFMRSGDNYRKPYRAAFTHNGAQAVQEVKGKVIVMTAKTDVLYPYLDQMPTPSPTVTVLRPADTIEAVNLFKQALADNPIQDPPPPIAATKPMTGRIWAEYLPVPGGCLYGRRNTDGSDGTGGGRPVVFIHASASSSLAMDRYMAPLIGKRPVLAVDLPGNGESDNPMGTNVSVSAQAEYLAQAIAAAGYKDVDIFGHWGGCAVAIELAVRRPDLVKHLALPTLMCLDDSMRDEYAANYAPPLELDEFGGHFIKAWNIMRDRELFAPWYKRDKAHIIRAVEPDISPETTQRRTLDLFKCQDIYRAVYAVHFSYPVLEKLTGVKCPILLGDPNMPGNARALKTAATNAMAKRLPQDAAQAASDLLSFFDGA